MAAAAAAQLASPVAPGGQDSFLSFASVFLHSDFENNKSSSSTGSKKVSVSMDKPTAFTPSRNNPARVRPEG